MNKYVEKCRELLHVNQVEDCLKFNNDRYRYPMIYQQLLNEISLDKELQNSILSSVYCGDDSIDLTKHFNKSKWFKYFGNKSRDLGAFRIKSRIFGGMFVDMTLYTYYDNMKILNKTVVKKCGNEIKNDEKVIYNKYYGLCAKSNHTKSLNEICECININKHEEYIKQQQS